MSNPLRKVKVLATGRTIEVYKLKNGNWCDYADCKTQYKPHEFQFLD